MREAEEGNSVTGEEDRVREMGCSKEGVLGVEGEEKLERDVRQDRRRGSGGEWVGEERVVDTVSGLADMDFE